jgi:hypothetical protein
MRDLATRNTHPSVVTIKSGINAYDQEGNSVTLDEALIQAEVARLQAEYDSKQYQRDRTYPPLGEQLDMIYHAGLGGDEFQATIKAIKDAHPKP